MFFYTDQGYVSSVDSWTATRGQFTPGDRSDPPSGVSMRTTNLSFPKIEYLAGPTIPSLQEKEVSHFQNFIDCVRSRRREDLHCDIEDGHLSTSLCHLANISIRLDRTLKWDPKTQQIVGDDDSNAWQTREQRKGFEIKV